MYTSRVESVIEAGVKNKKGEEEGDTAQPQNNNDDTKQNSCSNVRNYYYYMNNIEKLFKLGNIGNNHQLILFYFFYK